MGTKLNPGTYDCYESALPDEPMFTLLARDTSAPGIVRIWAQQRRYAIQRGTRPASDEGMCAEAIACAQDMEVWRQANLNSWKDKSRRTKDQRIQELEEGVAAVTAAMRTKNDGSMAIANLFDVELLQRLDNLMVGVKK